MFLMKPSMKIQIIGLSNNNLSISWVKNEAPPRFELGISCLLDRRFNQLSHGADDIPEFKIIQMNNKMRLYET